MAITSNAESNIPSLANPTTAGNDSNTDSSDDDIRAAAEMYEQNEQADQPFQEDDDDELPIASCAAVSSRQTQYSAVVGKKHKVVRTSSPSFPTSHPPFTPLSIDPNRSKLKRTRKCIGRCSNSRTPLAVFNRFFTNDVMSKIGNQYKMYMILLKETVDESGQI